MTVLRRALAVALFAMLGCAFAQQIELPRRVPKLAGKLLVATARSHDPDLGHAVILVIHSDVEGVMGLVINHPVAGTKPATWFGGPIPLGVRTLIRARAVPPGAERIFDDIYLLQGANDRAGARVYAGYAGWSVPQIQDELARRLWRTIPADAKLVFDPHPETLWRRLR